MTRKIFSLLCLTAVIASQSSSNVNAHQGHNHDHHHHHHDHDHDHDHGHHHHNHNHAAPSHYAPEVGYLEKFEFIETFQQTAHLFDPAAKSGWVKSTESRYSQQDWAHGSVQDGREAGIAGDKSIVVAVAHKHYGISKLIPVSIDNTDKDLVVQYEVRLHEGIGCSGAYLKLITDDKKFQPSLLNENTGYTIMFGPDRCGGTNKVHVIFRVKSPVTGTWEEKHLTKNIPAELDNLSHLYTLEVKKDNTFRVLVDLVEKASGSLLDESLFKPSFVPPKEIDDPDDKKPADWVDNEKMPDPEARKPDDWDENEPKRIEDPNASKPSGWEDFEPEMIADPNAKQPSDWVTEEDGEWEAPLIKNPKCSVGCGTWSPPIIDNPKYKGKWSAPMITNPNYIGPWRPRKIPNPNFYEDKHPSNLAPIAAVAIEILANERGIGFDNIVVGYNLDAARKFAEETFVVKYNKEKEIESKVAKEKRQAERELLRKDGGFNHLIYYGVVMYDFAMDNAIAVGVATAVGLLTLLYWCFSGAVPEVPVTPSQRLPQGDEDEEEEDEADDKKATSESLEKVQEEENDGAEDEDEDEDDGKGVGADKQ